MNGVEGELLKMSRDVIMHSQFQQQQQQEEEEGHSNNGGLTRYRSAPNSFFVALMGGNNADATNNTDSNETDNIFSAVMNFSTPKFSSNLKVVYGTSNNGNCSGDLIRQSSSPAGFFSGFDAMRGVGSFGGRNGSVSGANPTSTGLNNHMSSTSP